jgi:hypothetical protein
MRRATPGVAALILMLSPLLLGASDPTGDLAPCPGLDAGAGLSADAPDLVSARAEIVELGTSALWTFEFDRPLDVPDDRGAPFRVDVVLRDRAVPTLTFGPYRDINRLIRYDAVADPGLKILLLPEAAENTFIPPRIEGSTMQLQVPGRILSADEDETGTSPGLEDLRWNVIVRDESTCDTLGDARPTHRFVEGDSSSLTTTASQPGSPDAGRSWTWLWVVAVAAVLAIGRVVHLRFLKRAGG